jgi:hypothetical protein
VAEGVLLCEDELAVPAEVLVRRELLRDRRNDEPMSVTDDAIECLLVFLRCCGVVGTFTGGSYWLGTRGVTSGAGAGAAVVAGGRLGAGGGCWITAWARGYESEARTDLVLLLPKKDREKRPDELAVLDEVSIVWRACPGSGMVGLSQGFVQGAIAGSRGVR